MIDLDTPIFSNSNGDDMTLLDVNKVFSDLDDLLLGAKALCEAILHEDEYEGTGCAKVLMLTLDKMKADILKISVCSPNVSTPDKRAA